MSQTVAEILVGARADRRQAYFRADRRFAQSARRRRRRSKIEWIGVRHEEGAALAAAGQANYRPPRVCAGTTGPAARIWSPASMRQAATTHRCLRSPATCRANCKAPTTSRRRSPICCSATSRFTPRRFSPAQAPAVIHQAIAAAYAGRGVAHLTLPQDVIGAKADGVVSSVATLKPRPEIVREREQMSPISRAVSTRPASIVIMCGAGCHGAAENYARSRTGSRRR